MVHYGSTIATPRCTTDVPQVYVPQAAKEYVALYEENQTCTTLHDGSIITVLHYYRFEIGTVYNGRTTVALRCTRES